MAFTSLSFIAFITAVVLLTSALPTPGGRSLVLLGANLVFIASYIDRFSQVAPLAAFLLLSYFIIEGVRRSRSSLGLWAGLAVVIATFIVLKKFSFLGESLVLPFPYLIVGLSYVLFRVLHLMIDAKQGELAQPISPLQFFNYTCNFLSFTAGPIQRYQDYASQKDQALALDDDKVFRAFARVIKGFVKVGVISAIFNYLFDIMSGRAARHHTDAIAATVLRHVRGRSDLLHGLPVRQLRGLHGHRHRCRQPDGPGAAGELQPALSCAQLPRFLVALAHDAVGLVQDLCLQPAAEGAGHAFHLATGRTLPRRGGVLRHLPDHGCLARHDLGVRRVRLADGGGRQRQQAVAGGDDASGSARRATRRWRRGLPSSTCLAA